MAIQDNRSVETNMYNDGYRVQNPPEQIGVTAYNRAISRNLEEARIRSQQATSSYADMFNQQRSSAYRQTMAGAPQGYTGGMRDQYQGALTAAQMGAANRIGVEQERTLRDIDLNRIAMDRQAIQEAYQEEDRFRQTNMYNLQVQQQIQAIEADDNLTDEQKAAQITALTGGGMTGTTGTTTDPNFFQRVQSGESSAFEVGANVLGAGLIASSLPTLGRFTFALLNPATRSFATGALKNTGYSTIVKGASALITPPKALAATDMTIKLGTAAKAGGVSKVAGTLKIPKIAGVLGKFAMAHPVVALGVGAAIVAGGLYMFYQNRVTNETQPTQTNYASMVPTYGG